MFTSINQAQNSAKSFCEAMGDVSLEDIIYFRCFNFNTQKNHYDYSSVGVGETVFWQERHCRKSWADIEWFNGHQWVAL